MFENLNEAHGVLVEEVVRSTKPGFDPIPISLVSMAEGLESQLIIFDGTKYSPATVAKRLRSAAELLERQNS